MQQPKNTKFKKFKKGKINKNEQCSNYLQFGDIGLKSVESCRLTAKQIETGRRAINRVAKRSGKIWIRVFPDRPVSVKPGETRMGKGKGSIKFWVSIVKPGRILYELAGLNKAIAYNALSYAQTKLPIRTKIIEY